MRVAVISYTKLEGACIIELCITYIQLYDAQCKSNVYESTYQHIWQKERYLILPTKLVKCQHIMSSVKFTITQN